MEGTMRKTDRKAIAKLEALYARLPTVACKGLCSVACHSSIPLTVLEATRIRKAGRTLPMAQHGQCRYLTRGQRCGVYDVRPLICRVWGVLKRMSCMHGCIPDRWLSDYEFLDIAQAIERLAGPLVETTATGQLQMSDQKSLLLIDPTVPPDMADHYADVTRNLRALHGGRIQSVMPAYEDTWTNMDEVKGKLKRDA
jgi:Fe-S-cluster containining protein